MPRSDDGVSNVWIVTLTNVSTFRQVLLVVVEVLVVLVDNVDYFDYLDVVVVVVAASSCLVGALSSFLVVPCQVAASCRAVNLRIGFRIKKELGLDYIYLKELKCVINMFQLTGAIIPGGGGIIPGGAIPGY